MNDDSVPEGRLPHLGAGTSVDAEAVAALPYDLHGPLRGTGPLGEQHGEASGVRAADDDARAQPRAGEVGGPLVGDDPAAVQRDHVIGEPRRLLGIGRAAQHRPALRRVFPQHVVQPAPLPHREPSRGVVEHEGVRVRQEGAGQAQAAVQTAGQGAEAFVAQAHQAHRFEYFVSAPGRDPGGRAQHAEMSADRAGRVPRHVAQQHTDLVRGVRDAVQGAAPEVGDPTPALQFEHQPQRRRLSGARCSEQRGDAARVRFEGDVVDGGRLLFAGDAGQSDGLDHPMQDSAP